VSKAVINKAAGINLGLWVGLTMLVIGVIFLAWVLLKPPAPVTAAEAARKAREESGTQGPDGH
jgi:xanthine/uracil/vitamin C permease (AzgA family)